MKYLTIQEIQCVGPDSCEERIDPLMESLLDLEAIDDAITDPDLGPATPGWMTTTAVTRVAPSNAARGGVA